MNDSLRIMVGKGFAGLISKLDGEVFDVISDSICSICHSIFNSPVTTECVHTFCGACIKRVLSNKNNNGCPLCKNAVNRRDLVTDETRLLICDLIKAIPSAFKADIEDLANDFNKSIDDIPGCKTFEFSSPKNDKKKGKKERNSGNKSDNVSFVPVVRKSDNVSQYRNKKKEVDDLLSVTQMTSQIIAGTSGSDDKKLESVEKIPPEEKINNWLDIAGDNLFNFSNTSIIEEKSSEKIDETKASSSSSSSMIRVDYKKGKNNSPDPYEFVASQTNYAQKKKRGRKPNPNKNVPDFKVLHSFTKESVRRSQMNLQDDKQEGFIKFDAQALDEILSPEKIPDTIRIPTMTASQKFDHLLLEETKEDEARHVLYSPKSDQSLLCTYESEPKVNKPGCSKDSSDLSDLGVDQLFSTPKQKRKKSNEGGAKKKSRIIEVLEDINGKTLEKNLSDGNISSLSRSPGWSRVSGLKNDFEKVKKRGRPKKKLKSLNVSGGEKALSASKSNVSVEVEERVQKIETMVGDEEFIDDASQISERVTGFSEQSPNEKEEEFKKMVEDMEEELNRSNSDFTIVGREECSSAEIITDTGSEELKEKVVRTHGIKTPKAVSRKVPKVIEESSESVDETETAVSEPQHKPLNKLVTTLAAILKDVSHENMTSIANSPVPELPIATAHVSETPIASAHVPETPIASAHVPETPIASAHAPETPIASAHLHVPETPIAPLDTPIAIAQAPATSTPVLYQNNRRSLTKRRKSQNSISFTISGRIKKKKKSSTIFLQVGKLAPLFTSKSNIVKLVFPTRTKVRRSRSSSVGIQTPEVKKTRDSFVQTSQGKNETQSVGVQMTQPENAMRSVGVQSTQKNVSCSAQTSQIDRSSVGVQMTQVENVAAFAQTTQPPLMISTGVQMTQVKNVPAAAQTTQLMKSTGIQMTQVQNTVAVAQTSQSPLLSTRSAGILMTQVKNVTAAAQTTRSPLLSTRSAEVQTTQIRSVPAHAQTALSPPLSASSTSQTDAQPNDKDLFPSLPSVALRQCEGESEWEEIENLDEVKTQPDEKEPTQPKPKEDSILLDPEMENEFNTTWQKVTQKKQESQKQKNLRDYFSPRAKKIRRISSGDLESPIEILPEKYEGRQFLPLDVETVPLSETIDLVASQKNTQEQIQDVYKNIEDDLALIKKIRAVSENEEKIPKSQGEESDSDIFVEQTPPKGNTSRILDITQRSPAQNTETEIIADSIPPKEIENCEDFKTPPRKPILKTPHLGFPSKESFFKRKEPDENDQNKINNETKANQMKVIMQSWAAKKPQLKIVSSSISDPSNINRFAEKFKCNVLGSVTKEVTHLIVGLHDEDKLPLLTPKFLLALAYKKWILTEDWVEACLKANTILSEGPYESPDPLGGDACRRARLAKDPLFKDFEIHMFGDFEKISKEELGNVITACGASVVQHPTYFSFRPNKVRLIIVDKECNDYEVDEMSELFKRFKTAVLCREFIITSIECYKVANFTPFLMTLTSEDELTQLGYPYHLAKHEDESEALTFR